MAQTYLIKSSPTAGNRTKGTVSVWVKRSGLGSTQNIYTDFYSTDNFGGIRFNSGDNLGVFSYAGASAQLDINTTRVFRDTNAWYHIVVAWDTTDSTSTDRIKIYVNGVRETSFTGSPTYPSSSQNLIFGIGGTYPIVIGRRGTDNNEYFNGSMSHFHRVDNQALAPTVFGSTDSTTGEWKITASPSITYTGSSDYNFFILKDGNSLTDQSGQSNNLTLGYGTLSKTEDNPSNIFATMNPLWRPMNNQTYTFDAGNTRVYANSGTDWLRSNATIGAKTGKWWYEVYLGTGDSENRIGWDSIDHSNETNQNYYSGLNVQLGNGQVRGGIRGTSSYSPNAVQLPLDGGGNATWSQGDYLGMGIDLDNQTITIEKNGNALATNFSYAGYSGTSVLKSRGFFIAPSANWYSGSGNQNIFDFNFGNGKFGTSAALSGTTYTDSNGQGVFKYQPPTNYLAWCTKNLNV
jgi:hypothetical protein